MLPAIVNTEVIGQSINARELHTFLVVGRDFSTWINGRIDQYGFEEGLDYTSQRLLPETGEQRGGHNKLDYILSIDMAKELAMLENNDKGKEVRKYFIQCERMLKSPNISEETIFKAVAAALNIHSDVKLSRRLNGPEHASRWKSPLALDLYDYRTQIFPEKTAGSMSALLFKFNFRNVNWSGYENCKTRPNRYLLRALIELAEVRECGEFDCVKGLRLALMELQA